jgi:hypothetical protein
MAAEKLLAAFLINMAVINKNTEIYQTLKSALDKTEALIIGLNLTHKIEHLPIVIEGVEFL